MGKKIEDDALSNVAGGGGSPGDPNEDIELNTPEDPDPEQPKREAQDDDDHGVNFRG